MKLLLVPEIAPGHGGGHLRRCVRLLSEFPESRVLLPGETDPSTLLVPVPRERVTRDPRGWDAIIVDRFLISREEALELTGYAPTVGIDVGGPGRDVIDFLIDTLPRLDGAIANCGGLEYLDLPSAEDARASSAGIDQRDIVLVTYGAEDPGRLTEASAELMLEITSGSGIRVVAIAPARRELASVSPRIDVMPQQPSLLPWLLRARLVVTSFGLTAYEALAAGARVATVSPTPYHRELSRKAGFLDAGLGGPESGPLRAGFRGTRAYSSPVVRERDLGASRLPELIQSLSLPTRRGSPVYPQAHGEAIWRNHERSYFRCPRCQLIYMQRYADDREDYSEAYFMEEYQRQYGRTYLEDFGHIAQMGRRRVGEIQRCASRPLNELLDVGCAYGPFLKVAREAGLRPFGVDIAPAAVEYVTGTLNIPAVAGDIRTMDIAHALQHASGQFDAISLWYVIEHFPDLDTVLSVLRDAVLPGGVLALSTPHGSGVSSRRSRDSFFSQSPRDHYSIWEKRSAASVLHAFGFSLKRIVATGHHPERYPRMGKSRLGRTLAGFHSRAFGWGDTFELYAVREDQ